MNIMRECYAMEMTEDESATLTMYGEVVKERPTDFWTNEPVDGDYIVQSEFLSDLESLNQAKKLTVRVNSLGGDAFVGVLIHNRLRELAQNGMKLKCIVDGVAMSAGSVIVCACDNVEVNPSSIIMVHQCSGYLFGRYNVQELKQALEQCKSVDKSMNTIYQRKTGLSEGAISRLMQNTTYMTGEEAIEKGFADKLIEGAETLDIAASADGKSLFVHGRKLHLAQSAPLPDGIPIAENKIKKGAEHMKNEKTTVAEPAAANAEELVKAERQRLQEIDALAGLFDSETVNEAKYGEHPCSAKEMAYQAALKAAAQGHKFLAALEADTAASGAEEVAAVHDDMPAAEIQDSPQAMSAQAKADVESFLKMKGTR